LQQSLTKIKEKHRIKSNKKREELTATFNKHPQIVHSGTRKAIILQY